MGCSRAISYTMGWIVVAACMALVGAAAAQGAEYHPRGLIDVRNDLTYTDLHVQCSSDKVVQPVKVLRPLQMDIINYDDSVDSYWACTLTTAPGMDPCYPFVLRTGRFILWTKTPVARPCEFGCHWYVYPEGLSLNRDAELAIVHVYNWPK